MIWRIKNATVQLKKQAREKQIIYGGFYYYTQDQLITSVSGLVKIKTCTDLKICLRKAFGVFEKLKRKVKILAQRRVIRLCLINQISY